MRLIDADLLPIKWDGHWTIGVWKNDLDNAPTVDAAPIIYASWVEGDGCMVDDDYAKPTFRCSACGNEEEHKSNYCPYCGAVMEKMR